MATATIKPSGGDYADLTTWEAALAATLTAEEIAECYFFSGGLDDNLVIAGHTTSASNFPRVTVVSADRHAGIWSSSKFYIAPTTSGDCVNSADQYAVFEYMQLLPNTSANSAGVGFQAGSENSSAHHNLIDGQESSNTYGVSVGVNGCDVYRNVIWGTQRAFFGGIRVSATGAANIYSNTLYNNYYGVRCNGSTQICANNACFNNTTNFNGTFDTTNSGYNATDSASGAPGSNNQYSLTASTEFTSVTGGSEDFHLKSGATCIDNGTNLGSPYNIDIDGTTVTGTWDIGADEFVSAANDFDVNSSATATFTGASSVTSDFDINSLAVSTFEGQISIEADFSVGSAMAVTFVGETAQVTIEPTPEPLPEGGGYGWGQLKKKKSKLLLEDDRIIMEMIQQAMPKILKYIGDQYGGIQ